MSLKKIIAVFVSAVVSATFFVDVKTSAANYKYDVISAPLNDIVKENRLHEYKRLEDHISKYTDIYICYKNDSYFEPFDSSNLKFSDVTLYQIDASDIKSSGKIKATPIMVDSQLDDISPFGYIKNNFNDIIAYYGPDEPYFVKFDEKAHKILLSIDKSSNWGYVDGTYVNIGLEAPKFVNTNGYYYSCFNYIRGDYSSYRVIITSPDGKSKTKDYKRGPSYKSCTDGKYFYVCASDINIQKQIITHKIYRLDEKFNEKLIYKNTYSIGIGKSYPEMPSVVSSRGNYYYFVTNNRLIEYNLKNKTFETLYNSNLTIDVYSLNSNWVRINDIYNSNNKTFYYNLKTHKKIDVSKYSRIQWDGMINADTCYFEGSNGACILDLSKRRIVYSCKHIRESGNGVWRAWNDSSDKDVYFNNKLKKFDGDGITGFDDNNIALAKKAGKAYFVDQDFNQITRSFNAVFVDKVGDLFVYIDGTQPYFVTYTAKKTSNDNQEDRINASSKTSNSVALTWDGENDAVAYKVELYKDKKWVKFKDVTDTTVKITGLNASTKYYIRITAFKIVNDKVVYGKPMTITVATEAK